jgi:hypothetical protein
MTQDKSQTPAQRREELTESLPALSQKRTDTYRLNSDALALDRAGVKRQSPEAMEQLKENEAAADGAIRDAQRELRHLDAEIESAPRASLRSRLGRAARRGRPDR